MNVNDVIDTIRLRLDQVRHALAPWFHEDVTILQYRPKDGGWTSVQILEHITCTSHFLLLIIDKAVEKARRRAASNTVDQNWDEYVLTLTRIESVGVHKSFAWNRPEHMEPTGRPTLKEIQADMNAQFDRCDSHLNSLSDGEGILCKVMMTVNDIGKMDVYQYIYFLILHAERHLAQLDENKGEYNGDLCNEHHNIF